MVIDLVKERKFPTKCLQTGFMKIIEFPFNTEPLKAVKVGVNGRLKFRSEEIIPKSLWPQETQGQWTVVVN